MAKNTELIAMGLVENKIMTLEEVQEYLETGETTPVHTFEGWKARGRVVRKGEQSAAKISIWKKKKWISKEDRAAIDAGTLNPKDIAPTFKLVPACFFTEDQTEPLKA